MDVTNEMVIAINAAIQHPDQPESEGHFLVHTDLDDQFIIYGMDDPQRTYLALVHLRASLDLDPSNQTSEEEIQTIENRVETYDKSLSPRVSNFFLHTHHANVVRADDGNGFTLKRPEERTRGQRLRKREQRRREFTYRYRNSKFSLLSIGGDTQKLCVGVTKDNNTKHSAAFNLADMNNNLRNFAVRRACKFLLYDSIRLDKWVAYALDDMDLGAIAENQWRVFKDGSWISNPEDDHRRGKIPVCTSEIRCLFRDWDFFAEHVTFYEKFQMVDPPWLRPSHIDKWSAYAKLWSERCIHLAGRGADVAAFEAAIAAHDRGAHFAAISEYHRGNPSRLRNMHPIVTT
ncbi:MAG: hypothetical protein AAGJ28_17205 [Pseudomonadota bacterium]